MNLFGCAAALLALLLADKTSAQITPTTIVTSSTAVADFLYYAQVNSGAAGICKGVLIAPTVVLSTACGPNNLGLTVTVNGTSSVIAEVFQGPLFTTAGTFRQITPAGTSVIAQNRFFLFRLATPIIVGSKPLIWQNTTVTITVGATTAVTPTPVPTLVVDTDDLPTIQTLATVSVGFQTCAPVITGGAFCASQTDGAAAPNTVFAVGTVPTDNQLGSPVIKIQATGHELFGLMMNREAALAAATNVYAQVQPFAATITSQVCTTWTTTVPGLCAAPATPAPITAAPVATAAPVTAAPVTAAPVTAAPVTAAPVAVTAAPVTAAPVTAAPVAVTAAPVTRAPVAPTGAPVAPTAAPVAPTAAPVAPTAAPVAPTAAPVAATAAPVTAPPTAPRTPTQIELDTARAELAALGANPGIRGQLYNDYINALLLLQQFETQCPNNFLTKGCIKLLSSQKTVTFLTGQNARAGFIANLKALLKAQKEVLKALKKVNKRNLRGEE